MKKLILPLSLVLLFIFESLLVQLMPANLFGDQKVWVPRFLIITIFFLTIYGSPKHGIIYGLIFGLLFDIVFTEILGIYLFLYPLTAFIVLKIMKVLQVNLITTSVVSLIGVAILESAVYGMNRIIGITTIDFMSFLNIRLVPTLLLNAIFLIIASYPLKRNFEKFADGLRAD
jgi:rod shape-determining protein MreD